MATDWQRGDGTGQTTTIVTLPRVGKPPLRIKAARVGRVHLRSAGGRPLELALWVRPSGGVALQFSRLDIAGGGLDAVTLSDTEEALRTIERLCQRLTRPRRQKSFRRGATALTAADDLDAAQAGAVEARDFLVLAGEALDRWDSPAMPGGH